MDKYPANEEYKRAVDALVHTLIRHHQPGTARIVAQCLRKGFKKRKRKVSGLARKKAEIETRTYILTGEAVPAIISAEIRGRPLSPEEINKLTQRIKNRSPLPKPKPLDYY